MSEAVRASQHCGRSKNGAVQVEYKTKDKFESLINLMPKDIWHLT